MSSTSMENNTAAARALNGALRTEVTGELRIANLESMIRWHSVFIVVFVMLNDGFELLVAALLFVFGGPIRATLSPALIALHKRLAQLDAFDAALGESALLKAGDEVGWARWAELSAQIARAHGAAFEELPLTDAQRRLGVKLAAADRLQRLTDAISAQQAQIARLEERQLPVSLLTVVLTIAAPFVANHFFGRSSFPVVFLTTLWSFLIAVGVLTGFGAKIGEHQTKVSALEAQATSLRELLVSADKSDGAALMDRWLTLRAQQEDELLPWPTILEPTKAT
jgi:hypothetical protein